MRCVLLQHARQLLTTLVRAYANDSIMSCVNVLRHCLPYQEQLSRTKLGCNNTSKNRVYVAGKIRKDAIRLSIKNPLSYVISSPVQHPACEDQCPTLRPSQPPTPTVLLDFTCFSHESFSISYFLLFRNPYLLFLPTSPLQQDAQSQFWALR